MKLLDDKSTLEHKRRHLSQEHNLHSIQRTFGPLEMVPVYQRDNGGLILASLVPLSRKEEVVKGFAAKRSWPGQISMSGFFHLYDGVEPIVLYREFHGVKSSYQEICEEFRIFHNLYHDSDSNSYIKFDDAGNETVVAVVLPDEIRVRMKELTDFLVEKDMFLCLGFEFTAESDITLEELGIQEQVSSGSEDEMYWVLGYSDNSTDTSRSVSSSHLRGIRFITPLDGKGSKTDTDIKKYHDFIVGLNDAGEQVTRSCDPATIYDSNGVEGYLTPVVFDQAVLDKYINQPSKYSVDAFSVRCAGLWYLRIDNDREDGKVVVHLGDLANLPTYEEQSYWHSHNIPSDAGLSETAFRNQVLAEPANPGRMEYQFRATYSMLERLCDQHLDWQLLQPLHQDDTYRLSGVRIPIYNEQKAFDDFVGNLHNVLIDSLNSRQLATLVPSDLREQKDLAGKGIALLEEILNSPDIDAKGHIQFLRDLNHLWNKADGHRKGSDFAEALRRFGTASDLRVVSHGIMHSAVSLLKFLCEMVPALTCREAKILSGTLRNGP